MSKIVEWFNGKKTALGAVSLLLWIFIYVMPAFHPELNWVTHYGTQARDFMQAIGINLDKELANGGIALTAVGLGDKIRKMFSKEETKE